MFNVITGSATEIGGELTSNPIVRKLSFTGSTEIGKVLMAQCAATVKKLSLELGGNAPFIVFDDADLDAAVEGAIQSKYRNTGQTCVCANRLLVQDRCYDTFAAKLAAAVAKLTPAPGLDAGATQGPLIDDKAVEKVESHIADAKAKGAQVLVGGKRHARGGRFFEPTMLTGVTPAMAVAREETFGPVAPLFRFETEDEAIALANDDRVRSRRVFLWPRHRPHLARCRSARIRHRRDQYRSDFDRGRAVWRRQGIGTRPRRIEVRNRGVRRD